MRVIFRRLLSLCAVGSLLLVGMSALPRPAAAQPGPEIDVRDGVNSIPNGSPTPITIGITTVGVPVTKNFIIANVGDQDLQVALGALPPDFSTTFPGGQQVITPGNQLTLDITCDAPFANVFAGQVVLATNDADENPFTFSINCIVTAPLAPEIRVLNGAVDILDGQAEPVEIGALGSPSGGGIITRSLTILNAGTASLTVEPPQTTGIFTASINGGAGGSVIAPSQSASLEITCASDSPGTFDGTITFDNNDADENPFNFPVRCVFFVATVTPPAVTLTPTPTLTRTITLTPSPTITPLFFATPTLETPVVIPATFIFNTPTRTPLPPIACARQSPPIPRTGIMGVVNRDNVNVRLRPAIGADLVGFADAGYTFEVQARTPDSQWVRINFQGREGWIGFPVISIFQGDVNAAPVADPRTIPYGGFEAPRAGVSDADSPVKVKLWQSGLRVRSGPGVGYVVLANAPRYAIMPVFGTAYDGTWIQVNYEGTLGWIASAYVEYESGSPAGLPEGGICADGLPVSEPGEDGYTATLRLLLDRLNLAQGTLDDLRTRFTNAALNGQLQCGSYPPRPSDYNVPNPLLTPFYDILNPLQTDFNTAMGLIRQVLDALIDACTRFNGNVGAPGASANLAGLNQADALFAALRQRLRDLLPPDRPLGIDECLFSFGGDSEVVPRLTPGQIFTARLDPDNFVLGFCFDAPAGTTFRLEVLRLNGAAQPRVVVSNFRTPTQFIGQTTVSGAPNQPIVGTISNILITETGRYLVIISDLDSDALNLVNYTDLVILLSNVTGTSGAAPGLSVDPTTGQVIVNPFVSPILPTSVVDPSGCPSLSFTCSQLTTCEQARACYNAGNRSLDGDGDGTPVRTIMRQQQRFADAHPAAHRDRRQLTSSAQPHPLPHLHANGDGNEG